MKLAGRKIVWSTSMPCRPGPQVVERLLDAAGDVQRVRPWELLDDEHDARAVVDDRLADEGLVVLDELDDLGQRDGLAVAAGHGHVREILRGDDGRDVADDEPLVGRVDESAGPGEVAGVELEEAVVERLGDGVHDVGQRDPVLRSAWSGSAWTWSISSCSPQIAMLATPGTLSSRGRIVQYEIIDMSICRHVSELSPIFMTRLVADSGWSMTGGAAHVGSDGVIWASRSATSWRARARSVPGLNSRTT